MKIHRNGRALLWLGVTLLLAGCTQHHHRASSIVDYLYPDKSQPVVTPSMPVLSLPLRVGVAFVPDIRQASGLSEKDKLELLGQVSAEFKQYPFVKSIEIIPSAYLRPQGSFTNLDQIRTMFGLDVVALVSYDQVQYTDEGALTLAYWTLVGAYLVQGEKNDTSTMLDAAVYDLASRKLLFRAPGLSQVRGSATPVNLTEQRRLDTRRGFQLAAADLIVNLKSELENFKSKIKEQPEEYQIEHRPGYTGGGSLGPFFILPALAIGGVYWWTGKRRS